MKKVYEYFTNFELLLGVKTYYLKNQHQLKQLRKLHLD